MEHRQRLEDRTRPTLNTRACRSTVEQVGEEMAYLTAQAAKELERTAGQLLQGDQALTYDSAQRVRDRAKYLQDNLADVPGVLHDASEQALYQVATERGHNSRRRRDTEVSLHPVDDRVHDGLLDPVTNTRHGALDTIEHAANNMLASVHKPVNGVREEVGHAGLHGAKPIYDIINSPLEPSDRIVPDVIPDLCNCVTNIVIYTGYVMEQLIEMILDPLMNTDNSADCVAVNRIPGASDPVTDHIVPVSYVME